MASQKQIEANRRNAQKSTGPQSEQGKHKASKNSIKHGFTANTPVIPGEDQTAYDTFKAQLTEELNPTKGPTEEMLTDRIIDLSWRLKRSGRLHIDAYRVFSDSPKHRRGARPGSGQAKESEIDCGRIAIDDFADTKVFERLLVHERRIENSLYRTITELQRIQFIRTKYQSLLTDGEDYDDVDIQELDAQQRKHYFDRLKAFEEARRLPKQLTNN